MSRFFGFLHKMQRPPIRVGIIAVFLFLGFFLLFLLAYYPAPWTGFGSYLDASGQFLPGRTLWDWLQLLIIPIVISTVALLFVRAKGLNTRKGGVDISGGDIAARGHIIGGNLIQNIGGDSSSSNDIQAERDLQSYFDKMTELLLHADLLYSPEDSEIRAVARARTLAVLRNLDPNRQLAVLRFLRELSKNKIKHPNADITDAILFTMKDAELPKLTPGVDLSNTYLVKYVFYEGVDLSGATFDGADLRHVDFRSINLAGASFEEANTAYALFQGANLSQAFLSSTDLGKSPLAMTNLEGAHLWGTLFKGAILFYTNFSGVHNLTPKQLAQAAEIDGCVMPDGRKWQGKTTGPYTVEELAPYFPAQRAF